MILAILLQFCTILLKPVLCYNQVCLSGQADKPENNWVQETTKVLQAGDRLQRCQKWDTGTDNKQNSELILFST